MHIMLATHGGFAKGIYNSYQMIAGTNDKIQTVSLTDEGIEFFIKDFQAKLVPLINEEVLVMTDLKGGTPYNEAYNYYLKHPEKMRVLAGLNLPMLIEAGLAMENLSLDELYELALTAGKAGVDGPAEDSDEEEIEF
ncbi:PTS sugar transporter subunit IIA [Enterococcus sp. AZ109]|uniref:PTS sugar transporter subunit IIA n=1 Tax=Enterococcus sp. AZ109 TaxID=2774634 RepID=UPI003F2846A1